ncbi:MAG: PLDc N-terminal domain-containing protein [Actinomycetia bacterium]|nr:PLDc N-terminal domain-containing protein [Actinomycetes bacterium]
MDKKTVKIIILIMSFILLTTLAIASCSSEEAAIAAGSTTILGLVGIWIFFIVVFWAAGIFLFVVWIIMLVDCAKRDSSEFPNAGESAKTMWLLIILLTSGVGAIIYYFVVRKKMPRKA